VAPGDPEPRRRSVDTGSDAGKGARLDVVGTLVCEPDRDLAARPAAAEAPGRVCAPAAVARRSMVLRVTGRRSVAVVERRTGLWRGVVRGADVWARPRRRAADGDEPTEPVEASRSRLITTAAIAAGADARTEPEPIRTNADERAARAAAPVGTSEADRLSADARTTPGRAPKTDERTPGAATDRRMVVVREPRPRGATADRDPD